MKQVFENMIKIVEEARGVQDVIQTEMKKYLESNQKAVEDAGKIIQTKMQDAMKAITDPSNFIAMMQTMFKTMTDMVGEENFKKMMELQQQYPFLAELTKNFMPKQG